MFRFITAICLFAAFAAQTFERTFMVLEYYANTGSFAINCENKATPQMHCNGKCVLVKKLKQQENKDQQNPERKTQNKNEVVSSRSFFAILGRPASRTVHTGFPVLDDSRIIRMPRSFFHPPNA